jgi:hypothetical protein
VTYVLYVANALCAYLCLELHKLSGDFGNFADKQFFDLRPTRFKIEIREGIVLCVIEIRHAFQNVMKVMGHRGILRFEPDNDLLKRFDIPDAPIQINKIALPASLADGNNFHDRNIDGLKDADRAIPDRRKRGFKERI